MKSQHDFEHERGEECAAVGVECNWDVGELKGGDPDNRRIVRGRVGFPGCEDFYLQCDEVIELQEASIHRHRYGYFLISTDRSLGDDGEIGGFERTPHHGEHYHCGIHEPGGTVCGEISFKEATLLAWEIIGKLDRGEDPDCDPESIPA